LVLIDSDELEVGRAAGDCTSASWEVDPSDTRFPSTTVRDWGLASMPVTNGLHDVVGIALEPEGEIFQVESN
jgi:uncharacterized membrane protein